MNTQETDAQPTSAPVTISWAERDKMCHIICAHPRGHGHPHDHIVDVIPPGEGFQGDRDEMDANARLIRAAFESSTKAKEMGYDPQAAVEALPELLEAAKNVVDDTYRQETPEDQPFRTPPTKGAVDDLQYALPRVRDGN